MSPNRIIFNNFFYEITEIFKLSVFVKKNWKKWSDLDHFCEIIFLWIFPLRLSYLRIPSDESFSKFELFTNFGWKSGKKRPEDPVTVMTPFKSKLKNRVQ